MSSPGSQREAAVLESLLPTLEAEGFEVFVHPSRWMLPPFMATYQPDAIALKANQKIAIEIKADLTSDSARPLHLQTLFSEHPDWELRIVYAPPRTMDRAIAAPTSGVVQQALDLLPKIMKDAGPVPALLTAWAAFEAAARLLIPDGLQRPQPAARLLEMLASDGYITPHEANRLRQFGAMRDKAAHGDFSIIFTPEELREFLDVISTLIAMSPEAPRLG